MKNTIISRNPDYLNKKTGSLFKDTYEQLKSRRFKKYFPKYLKEVSQNRDYAPSSKVFFKAIRRAKFFYNPPSSFVLDSKWKSLFQNKIKCVKSVYHYGDQSFQELEKRAKHFPRLEFLQVSAYCPWKRNCKRIVFKFNKLLKGFEIDELTGDHLNWLEGLDSSQKFLCSLKKLRLVCAKMNHFDNKILEVIKKYKTLLKYTTSFVPIPLKTDPECQSFQMLEGSMPNLQSLYVQFSYDDANYLGTIGTFKNLKDVSFEINNANIFVRDFILPSSVQSLKLHFNEFLPFIVGLEFPQEHKESIALTRFYDHFCSLKNLKNLEIKFHHETARKFLLEFTENIVKRIPSLKSLILLPFSLESLRLSCKLYGQKFNGFQHVSKFLGS